MKCWQRCNVLGIVVKERFPTNFQKIEALRKVANEALYLPERDRAGLAQRLPIGLDSSEDRIPRDWFLSGRPAQSWRTR
uniref:Uncharacterized protein n=1 Tax=Candidatus Kentrum sp. LFY TaxID=2126342 RepID=A0A450WTN3_9GAMM|nr:MAG: hypothetical protein BECKLFY1418C_GA0070996_107213 [Candidatus Kentron sp. LFY]